MPTKTIAPAPWRAPQDDDLLDAALTLVRADGLSGLTLRPLAQAMGVTVSQMTRRFGSREAIIAAVMTAARRRDAARSAPWERRAAAAPRLAPALAADLADAMLEDCAGPGHDLALLFVEAVQASAWDDVVRTTLAPWRSDREALLADLAQRAGVPADVAAAGLVFGCFLDELAFSLALVGNTSYRMLRRLSLRRFFSGLLAPPDDDGAAALGAVLFDELDYPTGGLVVRHGLERPHDWRKDAEKACVRLIVTRGVGAVTHRAVAAQAGVPPTTLSYRFATQEDLVVAGLEYIIAALLRAVGEGAFQGPDGFDREGPDDPLEGLDVGRATFAVAIAATRLPRLAPCAGDMRRQRGVNLIRVLRLRGAVDARFDSLAAQALSVAMIGAANAAPIDNPPPREALLRTALAWTASGPQPRPPRAGGRTTP